MSDGTYRVILTGKIEPGFSKPNVVAALAKRFRLSADQADALVSGAPTTVKRGIDASTAAKFEHAVRAAGAACEVTLEPIPARQAPEQEAPGPSLPSESGHTLPTPPHPDPYAPPQATLLEAQPDAGVHPPQRVGAGRGFGWLIEGLGLFWQAKLGWVLAWVLFCLIGAASMLVPVVGLVAFSVAIPIFIAGVVVGADRQHFGGELRIRDLFTAFGTRPWLLAGIGAIYLAGSAVVTFVIGGLMGFVFGDGILLAGSFGPDATDPAIAATLMSSGMLLFALLGLICILPLYMTIWFTPALIVLNNELGLFEAIQLSFRGCSRNLLGFTLYGLGLMIISLIASIPLFLGWLLAGPLILASYYVSYRDIYKD